MKRPASRARPRGIALLMSLTVVMLLTFFMSEYFFATGLELRSLTTFKDSQQARMLSKSVFRAVQVALMQDEVTFFQGYDKLAQLLQVAAVPWENGLLVQLQVTPQDALFNLNQSYNLRPGGTQDRERRQVFMQILQNLQVPVAGTKDTTQQLSTVTVEGLYAALFDWIDADNDEYLGFPSVRGAEASAYQDLPVPYDIKNGQLDRLTEIRLVRGVKASGIPWADWEAHFTALPPKNGASTGFVERIDVNTASHQQIVDFLTARDEDPNDIGGDADIIKGIDAYANQASTLADLFAPKDGTRQAYDPNSLAQALASLSLNSNYGKRYLFTTINQYYRIRITTEVGDVHSSLEAMLHIPRDETSRTATGTPEVLWETIN